MLKRAVVQNSRKWNRLRLAKKVGSLHIGLPSFTSSAVVVKQRASVKPREKAWMLIDDNERLPLGSSVGSYGTGRLLTAYWGESQSNSSAVSSRFVPDTRRFVESPTSVVGGCAWPLLCIAEEDDDFRAIFGGVAKR